MEIVSIESEPGRGTIVTIILPGEGAPQREVRVSGAAVL